MREILPRLTWLALPLAMALHPHPVAADTRHAADPMDWIIQHICADRLDRPVPVDPYGGCPAGTTERRLTAADAFPYDRHDQPGPGGDHPRGFQRHDAYPIRDLRYGGIVAANDYDFDYRTPYGTVEPGDGDGYDVLRVADGWVTAGDTRDGGGYSQSFFGAACKPFGGWVLFPTALLGTLDSQPQGEAVVPIRGSYWEQNGEPWPGTCRPGDGFSTGTLTTWRFERDHLFGGHNGAPSKRLDAIVSTHGFEVHPGFWPRFHLERFFFTDLYGLTRWETWALASQADSPDDRCDGPTTMSERGMDFVRVDCRDWSAVDINDPPRPRAPWPYPEANLLENYHFDRPGLEPWTISPATNGGPALAWSAASSASKDDVRYSATHAGVRFIRLTCAAPCEAGSALSQDIDVAALPRTGLVDYGFSGLVDGPRSAPLKASLMQIDAAGHLLASTSFTATVPALADASRSGASLYKAASVFLTTAPLALQPKAAILRFALAPETPATYLIMDSWLMPR